MEESQVHSRAVQLDVTMLLGEPIRRCKSWQTNGLPQSKQPLVQTPESRIEHAKDEVISNDLADCDDKDLLRKWFHRTSLETLKDAEDEIVDEWLRSPVDPIDESTITSDLLARTSVAELSDIIIPDSSSEGEDAFPSTFPYTEIPNSQSDNRSLLSMDNSFVMSLDEEDEDYASDPAYTSGPDYVNESDSDDESDSNGEFDSNDDFEWLPMSRSRQTLVCQLSSSGTRIRIQKPGKYDKDVIVHLSTIQTRQDSTLSLDSRPSPLYNNLALRARTSLSFSLEALFSIEPRSFYTLIDEAWRLRDAHLQHAKMFDYMLWIKEKLGPDTCFRNSTRARYDHWKLIVGHITLGSQKATKSLRMTQTLSLEEFQHILTGMYEISHLPDTSPADQHFPGATKEDLPVASPIDKDCDSPAAVKHLSNAANEQSPVQPRRAKRPENDPAGIYLAGHNAGIGDWIFACSKVQIRLRKANPGNHVGYFALTLGFPRSSDRAHGTFYRGSRPCDLSPSNKYHVSVRFPENSTVKVDRLSDSDFGSMKSSLRLTDTNDYWLMSVTYPDGKDATVVRTMLPYVGQTEEMSRWLTQDEHVEGKIRLSHLLSKREWRFLMRLHDDDKAVQYMSTDSIDTTPFDFGYGKEHNWNDARYDITIPRNLRIGFSAATEYENQNNHDTALEQLHVQDVWTYRQQLQGISALRFPISQHKEVLNRSIGEVGSQFKVTIFYPGFNEGAGAPLPDPEPPSPEEQAEEDSKADNSKDTPVAAP
ncbi:hypothetical protein Neosp_001559 [[Neocosmospora] mangrovei]